ncbi:hypothetical protein [Desulfoferrobacter suflitae]|uniref:hypothetical protein n=1 Tax=Desulfoferrobacter suflitae TaxID=2865782 RepID=UPI00216425FF|nr:hypothetical protein [Desulfoferrobacter suflitae]MCK8600348.1 hypothetical protein [Desulfoferrobacter suflitae]
MSIFYRILICLGLVVLHYAGFFLPLTEIFLIYILLFNPRWFRDFLNSMAASG